MVTADNTFLGGSSGDGRTLMEQLVNQLEVDLELADFLRHVANDLKIEMTPGAYLMLLVPLAEVNSLALAEFRRTNPYYRWKYRSEKLVLDRQLVEHSLRTLMREMAESPAAFDKALPRDSDDRAHFWSRLRFWDALPVRTSISVVKAFWKRFCNIPPFCGETDE